MKVSVIVPVYNGEGFIQERIGNLLNQTLEDMEIIFVDDASTDGTAFILEAAKNQFPNKVRVFRQKENKGPGAARNLGLSVAQGDYIGFCDADDMVDVTMFEKLYQKAVETDADMVDCAFFRESQNKALCHFTEDILGEITNEQKANILLGGFMVTKLFRRKLFFEPVVLFREEYGLEDMDVLMGLIAKAKRFASVPEVLYVYKDSDASLSKEQDFFKYYRNHVSAMTGIYETLSAREDYEDYKDAAEICMATLYTNVLPTFDMVKGKVAEDVVAQMKQALVGLRHQVLSKDMTVNPYFASGLDESAKEIFREECKYYG